MRNRYRYIFALFVLTFLFVGCEEFFYGEQLDIVPSLHPRYLSVSPKNITIATPNESTAKISVVSERTPWTFERFPSWVSLNPVNGESNTDVKLTAITNQSADTARYSLFFFSSAADDWDYTETLTISQPAAKPYLSVSTNRIEVSGAASEYSVDVYTNASWSFKNSSSWVVAEKSGSLLVLRIKENHTGRYRDATVYFTAQNCTESVHIIQSPANATTVEEELEFPHSAATGTFVITSEVEWSATVSKAWLQISPESGVAGTTEVKVDIAPNQNIEKRTGYITFQCGSDTDLLSIKVVQQGIHLSLDTDNIVFEAQACDKELSINSNIDWIITSYPQWAIPSTTSGNGNAVVNIHAEENLSTNDRSGYFVVEYPGLSLSAKARFTQKGKYFNIGVSTIDFSDKASVNTIKVVAEDAWEATCSAEWVSLSPQSASGNTTLSISVTENTAPDSRIAIVYVTMRDKTVELLVKQQGKYLSLGDAQLDIPTQGGNTNLFIDTNDKWQARLENNATWLSLSKTEGEGKVNMVVTATDNTSLNDRSDVLEITTVNSLSTRLPIMQEGRFLTVSASDILFFARGGTSENITIKTNGAYKITQMGEWFVIKHTGNSFVVTTLRNETDGWREGSITITLTDLTEGSYAVTIPVVQIQVGCDFTISDYDKDENQDNASGEGGFNNNKFNEDIDWDASLGKIFGIHLTGFTIDNDWNAKGGKFTVTATGYADDKEWNNKDSVNTTIGKDSFGDDKNQNANSNTDATIGKDNFGNDKNEDVNNSTDTTIGKDNFGNDKNEDVNNSTDTTIGKDNFGNDKNEDANNSTDTTIGKDNFGNDKNEDVNNSTDTTIGKENFGDDKNQDENNSTETTIDKDNFDDDKNQNNDDASSTTLGKQGYDGDDDWNE